MPDPTIPPFDWETAARNLQIERDALLLENAKLKLPVGPLPKWYESPRAVGVISEVSGFLTLLAALPYELGAAADIVSSDVKKYVASIGVFATLALRLWKRYLEPKPTETK